MAVDYPVTGNAEYSEVFTTVITYTRVNVLRIYVIFYVIIVTVTCTAYTNSN